MGGWAEWFGKGWGSVHRVGYGRVKYIHYIQWYGTKQSKEGFGLVQARIGKG